MRLLLTRPRPEADRTAAALCALGHDTLFAPMLEIENLPAVKIGSGPWAAILMTSGNAARAVAGHSARDALVSLDCFAVGTQTAEAARQAGFANVVSAGGDGGDLARRVADSIADRNKPLLYLAGNDRARDMDAELAAHGLRVETIVVYRANAAESFAPDIATALTGGGIDGALHYSRRSTAIFVDCARKGGMEAAAARLKHFCLSARAAEPLREMGAASIFVAQRPDKSALLQLMSEL